MDGFKIKPAHLKQVRASAHALAITCDCIPMRRKRLVKKKMAIHDVKLSKSLAWVLRHQAVNEGLDIQADGYVPCSQVVELLSKRSIPHMTQKMLEDEVAACPKHRFQLTPCKTRIRASRGHSIRTVEDSKLLQALTDVDVESIEDPVYGTNEWAWTREKTAGLSSGSKNHIHIATKTSKHGYRIGKANTNANILIFLDIAGAMADGIVFYKAANGVLLTRGVGNSGCLPSKYFLRAVRHNADGSTTEF